MNFELTPQQKAVQQSARQFAQTVLQETVLEDDAAGRFPEEAYKKMGEMGFVGLPFPKEYGGQGGDYLSYVLALEEISKINSSVGIAYSVCTSLYSGALINDGNEEQKKKYLPEVLSGKKMGSFCLTEPDAGSDAAGCKTTWRSVLGQKPPLLAPWEKGLSEALACPGTLDGKLMNILEAP